LASYYCCRRECSTPRIKVLVFPCYWIHSCQVISAVTEAFFGQPVFQDDASYSFFSRTHRRTALHTLSTLLFFFASVLQILLTVGAVKETLFDGSCQGNSAEPSETLYARVFMLFSEVWNQCTGALSSKFWSITILFLRVKFLCSKLAPFFVSMRGGSSIAFRL